eukprot:764813-Hanusia_phi.AAC.1
MALLQLCARALPARDQVVRSRPVLEDLERPEVIAAAVHGELDVVLALLHPSAEDEDDRLGQAAALGDPVAVAEGHDLHQGLERLEVKVCLLSFDVDRRQVAHGLDRLFEHLSVVESLLVLRGLRVVHGWLLRRSLAHQTSGRAAILVHLASDVTELLLHHPRLPSSLRLPRASASTHHV